MYAPLHGPYSFAQQSITIHDPNGDRMACGPTEKVFTTTTPNTVNAFISDNGMHGWVFVDQAGQVTADFEYASYEIYSFATPRVDLEQDVDWCSQVKSSDPQKEVGHQLLWENGNLVNVINHGSPLLEHFAYGFDVIQP